MKSLAQAVTAFRGAFAMKAPYAELFYEMSEISKRSTFAERDAAILALLEPVDHVEVQGIMCVASGSLVEDGASTTLGMDTILDWLADGTELLAKLRFDEAHLDSRNPPPNTLAFHERCWVAAWKEHVRGAMARLARDVNVRKQLRAHPRLVPAVRALAEITWANHLRYIVDVIDMLDDEPIHVIDLCAGGTLTRYRAYGIRNGFHLMTLLEGQDPVELVASEADFVRSQHDYYIWAAIEETADGFTAKHLGSFLWGEPRAIDI